jgi:P4 family phage/plasmid primase-like protien
VTDQAIEFIKTVFGPTTEAPVHVCSLGNERDGPHAPRQVSTRDMADITKFIAKWDQKDRGLFFCVGTLKAGKKREKANVAELALLHADIDFKDIATPRDEVLAILQALECPPSIINRSGNGFHCYWLLTEAILDPVANGEADRIEATLRLLADTVGGDGQCAEISRLMRMPGTHNSKKGSWVEVTTELLTDRRYELDDIEEWLSRTSPKIQYKEKPVSTAIPDDNPFLAAARQHGFKPSIDVEQRLSAMTYGGTGDSSIHGTQLSVSASMLGKGADRAEVIATIMAATVRAAGPYGIKWNWGREERAVERMCDTWLRKNPPAAQPRSLSSAAVKQDAATLQAARQRDLEVNGAGGPATVHNLAEARKERAKPKKRQASGNVEAATAVADGVIESIRRAGHDILLTEGEIWIYASGIWHVMTPADQQWIMTLIQEGFETLGEPLKTGNLNAAYKRLCEHPGLYKREVQWANSDLIVCQNGVLEIKSRQFHSHSPKHYARRKIGAAYDTTAQCPKFVSLVGGMFADRPEGDQQAFVGLVQSWCGAALAISHLSREERKALILVGPSRTGKTELSRVIRLLIGDPIATPSVAEISERFGLSSLYDAAAWIRDDAINEGDDLDPQRFKTIVTGEPIDIERKHRAAVPGVELALPVLLTTNALPRARDKSDAIFNRAIVLEMTHVVSEDEAHSARLKAGTPRGSTLGQHLWVLEGSGILNWALEGLARLLDKGSYDIPESVRNAIQRFKDDNNPVGEWARSALVKAPYGRVTRGDLMCAYHGWQREQDGDEARAFGARGFFPRLRAAFAGLADMTDNNGRRYIAGVHLTDEGLQLWDSHVQGPQLKGGSKGTSATKHEVNKTTPSTVETGIPASENETKGSSNEPRF